MFNKYPYYVHIELLIFISHQKTIMQKFNFGVAQKMPENPIILNTIIEFILSSLICTCTCVSSVCFEFTWRRMRISICSRQWPFCRNKLIILHIPLIVAVDVWIVICCNLSSNSLLYWSLDHGLIIITPFRSIYPLPPDNQ